jgi:hypothetical protein
VTGVLLTAFEISWDPGLRGMLSVLVGVVVLVGSVWLILSTNLGSRVGVLVALAGLSGWMTVMGIVWALYGIGYKGPAPSWHVEEIVRSESADDLSGADLEAAHDLSDWNELPADDPSRGESAATASAELVGEESPIAGVFESEAEFQVVDAFEKGGKDDSFLSGWLPGPHPPHYAIVQVQAVVPVETELGQTPPPPTIDESQPVYSVIMVRDLGALRLPSVTVAISMAIVFGLTCNALHRRDKAVAAGLAASDT